MIIWLINSVLGKDPDCITHAIIDFLIIGIQTGWRSVEWAQPQDPTKYGFYKYNKASRPFENRIYALCIEDRKYKYTNGRIVTDSISVADADVARTVICWRYQKNFNHGQEIEFEISSSNLMFCFCLAALRVYQRFVRICDRPNTPVAVYWKNAKSRMYLTRQTRYWIKTANGDMESLLSRRRRN